MPKILAMLFQNITQSYSFDTIRKLQKKVEQSMQNTFKNTIKIITVYVLIVQIHPFMPCFAKKYESPSPPPIDIISDQSRSSSIKTITQSELRSYHPHYLSSLSYPYPITPHIYFGQVIGKQPLFSMKHLNQWNPTSISKLSVNGVVQIDQSFKSSSLSRQQPSRFMLVIQIQNSFEQDIGYSMNVFRRKDHFLVVCEYKGKFNAFVIYITQNDDILNIDRQSLKRIKLNIRNQSNMDLKQNWKLSQKLFWKGFDTIINSQSTAFVGLVLELECIDSRLIKGIRINLQEISNQAGLAVYQFAKQEQSIDLKTFIPQKMKKIIKNTNCSNAAAQKVFEGLSYQYGTLKIKNDYQQIINSPQQLLSFSPSRKRFPWGFLWDDGFHCQVTVRKDEKLTLRIVKSWLDTMMSNGWIPRQQNRGQQREQLCSCPRFMEKDMRDGNPPTLILPLWYLRKSNRLNQQNFPKQYWNKLKKWYSWFITSQKDDNSFLFRWKDSINQAGASFTSGMDDFPRPMMTKANIDLQSWIYFFTKFMAQSAHIYSDSNVQYTKNLELLKENFKYFIESSTNIYKDVYIDGTHSQHFGYPSILPIAFGVPSYGSKQYKATINMIKEHLDTGAGLSSISKQSPHYLKTSDAYWRGPVWINLNYIFLRGLKLYYPEQSQFYSKIRKDLLRTVCGNWQKSGYFYQNYIKGVGSFSFPFNGWTSLISIISDQNY